MGILSGIKKAINTPGGPALAGAALGSSSALLSDRDPVMGALMGGVAGGAGGGHMRNLVNAPGHISLQVSSALKDYFKSALLPIGITLAAAGTLTPKPRVQYTDRPVGGNTPSNIIPFPSTPSYAAEGSIKKIGSVNREIMVKTLLKQLGKTS